jgi:hypothetical protein
MERLGLATAQELDAEDCADLVLEEVTATDSVVVGRSEVAAWART